MILVVNCFQNTTLVDDSQVTTSIRSDGCVVNCFQNTTLVDDSQAKWKREKGIESCELLSEYYFSR